MARTVTNESSYSLAYEDSQGVLNVSPTWFLLEPNEVSGMGATTSKVAREPISKNRQRRKGAIVDIDSAPQLDMDITMDHMNLFIEGFMFSIAKGATNGAYVRPTSVTTTAFVTAAMAAAIPSGRLVFARGFLQATNNGLKHVTTGGTTTNTPITGGGMTAETTTAAQNATLEVAGVRGATSDIVMTAGGNLTSTVLDFTTLGLTVGQWIFIGGDTTISRFASAANRGYARVIAIAAGQLTLDKRSNVFVADAGTGQTIEIYFGRFVRNVAVDHADYLTRYHRVEALYNDLNTSPGVDEYEYAVANLMDEMTISLAVGELATMSVGMIGTDAAPPSTTRATNAATALVPTRTAAFSPTSDIARLRVAAVDDSGISTDFKTLEFTIRNNITPEKTLGRLGAAYINTGLFEIDIEATTIFTNNVVPTAVRTNVTVGFDMALRNGDGGFVLDMPEGTLSTADKELPRNESINLQGTIMAHQSATFGYSLGVSLFPFVPSITI
jgi:hypothetical protein